MKTTIYSAIVLGLLCTVASPAQALTCAIAGTAPGALPNDFGEGTAVSCGDGSQTAALEGVAIGKLAQTNLRAGVGIGASAKAFGQRAVSIGSEVEALSDFSIAMGWMGKAFGSRSTAIGLQAETNGFDSLALGSYTEAANNYSVAIGPYATVAQEWSMVLGSISNGAGVKYTDVAMGTPVPEAALHVSRNDGTTQLYVEDTDPSVAPRTLFRMANAGNTKFEIENTDAANSWAFTNSGIDFRMSLQGSGSVEFRVDNTGDAYVAGMLFELSDRNAKTNITPVDQEAVLAKVAQMPINQWAYKDSPDTNHIGPMAQDFRAAFGTGTNDTTLATMDVGGVAIASIQALQARNQALETRVRELESLADEVAALKAMIRQLSAAPLLTAND